MTTEPVPEECEALTVNDQRYSYEVVNLFVATKQRARFYT